MTFAAAVVLSFVLYQPISAQDPVAKHRAMYQFIEGNLSNYRSTHATRYDLGLEERSVEGGWIQAYCDGTEIRKIFEEDDGETSTGTRSLYYDHDSLFFVFVRDGHGQMTESSGPYPKRTAFEEERLYFTDGKLVRWLGNKNEPADITSDSAKRHGEDILAEGREYHELMPACNPKPRTRAPSASDTAEAVKRIREIYNIVERERPGYRHVTSSFKVLGLGKANSRTLEAFCDVDAIRLLVVSQSGRESFYFDRDQLVFAYRVLPSNEEERYYFAERQLVRWLGAKNEPRDVTSADAKRDARELNTAADSYKDAMRFCSPRP